MTKTVVKNTVNEQAEELVTVKFFKDNGKYKDDIVVSVNGKTCIIQRGVQVTIKRKFLWAIENSMAQDAATVELIEAQASEFSEKMKKISE